jgi:DNA-binding transcriptional regulator PaaX
MSWTFLSNHGHVVIQISRHPDIRLTDLAAQVGVTERHARAIVNDLREAGYVEVTKSGRRNAYRVNSKKPLRHSAESDHSLNDLLTIFRS